jgi:signal transduction histidine kinase
VNAGVELLFDEFAAGHARGEYPDAREYLERAGERRDELARLLDGFLAAAPVQPPGEETLALFASLLAESFPEETATPPLLAERVRRGWRRDEIVDWIRERFGIGEEKQEKVARYWHELETGLVPVSGVSERLREALSERFGEAVQAALSWEPRALDERIAFRRAPGAVGMELHERLSTRPASPATPRTPERDEVDELFLGPGM